MFSKEVYTQRRALLKEHCSAKGVLLFLGNEESPMNYVDNPYHFRQDSTFLYFFGLDSAGLAATIDLDEGTASIFGNDLTVDDIVWMGPQPTLAERAQSVGISNTAPHSDLSDVLSKAQKLNRPIHFLPPYRPENRLKLYTLLNIDPTTAEKQASVEFIKAVVNLRNYKSPEEIVEIEKAADITVDMHHTAMQMIQPEMTEATVAAAVNEIAEAAGGHVAFPIIATKNGQTLHNHYHGNVLREGDLFLLDAGAETPSHYAADMSSTIPISPTFTERQRDIYQVALQAHEKAVSLLQPGITNKEVHIAACTALVEGLKELGFMKGDPKEAVAQGAHALFFPCGTGHMMGLDVHDMEDLGEQYVGYDGEKKSTQFGLKSLRLARKLEPGFVLTIEPGIYFIPQLIEAWQSQKRFASFLNYDRIELYKDFGGVRNEEDFLITEQGARLLGKPLAKTIDEVEALRR